MSKGIYNSTAPTLNDGGDQEHQLDSSGNLKSTLATALDKDIDSITIVPEGYSYATITTATTTNIASGVGTIGGIEILGGTLGAITVYDNTAGSGTVIAPTFTPTGTVPIAPILKDISFSVGLTIVTAAATIITVKYN